MLLAMCRKPESAASFDHLGGARDELHKRLYLICINAVARKHKCDVLATRQHVELKLQLFNSSEKRLARVLLLMANFGKEGKPEPVITKLSQETLAEIIGTTRSRVSTFMNKFRDLGFINYNGELEVHNSLLNVILHDKPQIRRGDTGK
jgi:hypothetical protein